MLQFPAIRPAIPPDNDLAPSMVLAPDSAGPLSLHAAVARSCPIRGISVVDPADRNTWRVDYRGGATAGERAAANSALRAWAAP